MTHVQISKAHYAALYRIARIDRRVYNSEYCLDGYHNALNVIQDNYVHGSHLMVSDHFLHQKHDRLALKLAQNFPYASEHDEDLDRALYRYGEAYERYLSAENWPALERCIIAAYRLTDNLDLIQGRLAEGRINIRKARK